MTGPLAALRHIFGGLSSEQRGREQARAGAPPASPAEEDGRGVARADNVAPTRGSESGGMPAGDGERGDSTPRLARHLAAYLNVRAEEMLVLLLQELSKETTRELGQRLENTHQAISSEVAEVQQGVVSSQRELSRIGRELLRSGAALESMREAVSTLGPAAERLEASVRGELARQQERDRHLREEAERAALDDTLATLDGLEVGLAEGHEFVHTLAEAQRRLKDATVQRWWRAMGEATGVKRPLPQVPAEEVEGWISGLELTHRRLQDVLTRRGVTPIEAVGKPFDPFLHEAVAVEPCLDEQDGLVLREQRRGYRTADRVVRLSQVVVGRAAPAKVEGRRRRHARAQSEPVAGNPVGGTEVDVEPAEAEEGGSDGVTPSA